MVQRFRVAMLAASLAVALLTLIASAASANPLTLLGGNCGFQTESHPFAPWGDGSSYTPVPGGDFESGFSPWLLSGGAARAAGNESFQVAGPGSSSLSLPTGSAALSPASCTNIFHPTVRFFMRNTGSARSHLIVQALYPGLLGGIQTATVATLTGSSSWAPSPAIGLLISNLLSTLSLNETVVAFRFVPADNLGEWSIDDVYLDPFARG